MSPKRSDSSPKKRKPAASKRPASKRKPTKKKPAASKARPKARNSRSKAPKRKPGKRRPPPKAPARVRLRNAFLGFTSAVAIGGMGATYILWQDARSTVETWLEEPAPPTPTHVWSAPMRVQRGEALSADFFERSLRAAGYERTSAVSGPMQYHRDANSFSWSTAAWTDAVGEHPAAQGELAITDGRVAKTTPAAVATVHPVRLATVADRELSRERLDLASYGEHMPHAVMAMEDARFFDHFGIDLLGVVRAIAHNIVSDGMHGGSTLTQQLAKNLFLSQERSLRRKVREAAFSVALESVLTKEELLALYLSEVYLGHEGGEALHGVQAAAKRWFGVNAESLTPAQAATIAGVIASPNRWSPTRHPEAAVERRNLALGRLADEGWISETEAKIAKASSLEVLPAPGSRVAPWAVDLAVAEVGERYDLATLSSASLNIYTSVQPHLQDAAERAIRDGLGALAEKYEKAADAQAALVAVRQSDGAVLAIVGGKDYASSPFHRAVDARRGVGSTVKPLVLLAALDRNPSLTPSTRLQDEAIVRQVDGKTWSPENYDRKFVGPISLRQAIEQSRNIPAVLLAEYLGKGRIETRYQATQAWLRKLGLDGATSLPSVALGAFEATPWQMAAAYTALDDGIMQQPWLLQGVVTPDGETVLDDHKKGRRVASEVAAALATNILEGVVDNGTGRSVRRAGVRGAVAGKTGTTNAGRDAWFVGYTPDIVVAVWVGLDRGSLGLGGGQAAAPIFAEFVGDLAAARPFPEGKGLVEVDVCDESQLVARKGCENTHAETFRQGHVPEGKCDIHGAKIGKPPGFFQRLFGKKPDVISSDEPLEEGSDEKPKRRKRKDR